MRARVEGVAQTQATVEAPLASKLQAGVEAGRRRIVGVEEAARLQTMVLDVNFRQVTRVLKLRCQERLKA
jgi:hypothetical protein